MFATKQLFHTSIDDGIRIVEVEWRMLFRLFVLVMATMVVVSVVMAMTRAQIFVLAVLQLVSRIQEETRFGRAGQRQRR